MNEGADPLYWPVYGAVVLIWAAYGLAFLARTRPPDAQQRRRKNGSLAGIAVVGVGFMLAWAIRRPATTPLMVAAPRLSYAVELLAVPIGIASVWLTLASIRTLGKQWNLRAALVTDHTLVEDGPYGHVRHPLYLGMLGLMLTTTIANATWWGSILSMAAGIAGTIVRVHYEEMLLLDAFGAEFVAYRRDVPALLPRPFRSPASRNRARSPLS